MGHAPSHFSVCFFCGQADQRNKQKRHVEELYSSEIVAYEHNTPALVISPAPVCNQNKVISESLIIHKSEKSTSSSKTTYPAGIDASFTLSSTTENSWAWLPSELVGSIAEQLPIGDYFRFRAVCSSWDSAVSAGGYLPHSNHFPWLMIQQFPYTFLSLLDNRSYCFPLEASGTECLGSQDGWLVNLNGLTELCLLNPITRSRVDLPAFSSVHIRKVVLSPSTASGSAFIIVAMYGLISYRLAYTRAGDASWAPVKLSRGMDQGVEDVVYHEGKFFTISSNGRLEAIDLDVPSPKISSFPNSYNEAASRSATYNRYLVSSSGDLLHVWKERNAYNRVCTRFTVMKFNPNMYSCWEEITDLGTQTLFLDSKHSMSLAASNVMGLKGNCIYFTNERMDVGGDHVSDVGIFDVEKRTIELCFAPKRRVVGLQQLPMIWFTPSLS